MIEADFKLAFEYWLTQPDPRGKERKFPHDKFPGYNPDGYFLLIDPDIGEVTELTWSGYIWNPAVAWRNHHAFADRLASGKPLWETIVFCLLESQKLIDVEEFRVWTRKQICGHIFGAHDVPDEIMNRAAGNYTEEQEAHNDAVVAVHNAQRLLIQAVIDIDNLDTVRQAAYNVVTDSINNPPED